MNLQTLEELITAEILASRTGQYFWTLLQKINSLKKNLKILEVAQHPTTTSICSARYTYNLTIFTKIMFPYLDYNIDPLRNRVVNGTIYADQFYKIFKKIRVQPYIKTWPKIWLKDSQYQNEYDSVCQKIKRQFVFATETISWKSRYHHFFRTLAIPS